MLRLLVLCLALTLVNSRLDFFRDYAQKGELEDRRPLDDWRNLDDRRHLEANEIPANPDDRFDYIDAALFFYDMKPRIPVAHREEQPSDTTDSYAYEATDAPEPTYEPTVDVVEETENSTLPDYTEESDGYLLFPGIGRFILYNDNFPWEMARERCVNDGGDLAIPDSEEKVAVFMKMYEMHPEIPARAILRQQVYIGIQDPQDTREFVTVKGEPVSLDNPLWAKGEPDNEPPGEEDCVTFRTDARIRDVPCYFSLPFFCEKPL